MKRRRQNRLIPSHPSSRSWIRVALFFTTTIAAPLGASRSINSDAALLIRRLRPDENATAYLCSNRTDCWSCLTQAPQQMNHSCRWYEVSQSCSSNPPVAADDRPNIFLPPSPSNVYYSERASCPASLESPKKNATMMLNGLHRQPTRPSLIRQDAIREEEDEDEPSSSSDDTLLDDPGYQEELWAMDMIRIRPVWEQGYTGQGIHVRINDNGVDAAHVEFQGRFSSRDSCPDDVVRLRDNPMDHAGIHHGTAVASIVGAARNNGVCAMGVAPQVTLSSCNALGQSEAFLEYRIETVDISQNAYERPACQPREETRQRQLRRESKQHLARKDGKLWKSQRRRSLEENQELCPFSHLLSGRLPTETKGFERDHPCLVCDESVFDNETKSSSLSHKCESSIFQYCQTNFETDVEGCSDFLDIMMEGPCTYHALSETARVALTRAIHDGRRGKGTIVVFAVGNANALGDYSTIKPYTNTRFAISVGAVGKDERHASYSTPGASLFLVAPGGDAESPNAHLTALAGGTCGFPGVGTSFACPVVSGVVALLLQANPELGWRDVQGVLAVTARPTTSSAPDPTRTQNGAGLIHSNLYGFGIVDAQAAVQVAETWENYTPEQMEIVQSGLLNEVLVDDELVTSTSHVTVKRKDLIVESVGVFLDLQHLSRGDLEIVLTSPHGTESILHPGKLPETSQLDISERWKLLTVRNWGENAHGDWALSITDRSKGYYYSSDECVDAPLAFVYTEVTVTCEYLEEFEICADNSVSDEFFEGGAYARLRTTVDEDNGKTIEEQCCVCGGGLYAGEADDVLKQWRLVLYGHMESSSSGAYRRTPTPTTITPSDSPTKTRSDVPSSDPSAPPSLVFSDVPSWIPSDVPTSQHSEIPSDGPSTYPSTPPTFSISVHPSPLPSPPPTQIDSSTPSLTLSTHPSEVESTTPSQRNSDAPTLIADPTAMPTQAQSDSTVEPTNDSNPAVLGTSLPTLEFSPSRSPSIYISGIGAPARPRVPAVDSVQPDQSVPSTPPNVPSYWNDIVDYPSMSPSALTRSPSLSGREEKPVVDASSLRPSRPHKSPTVVDNPSYPTKTPISHDVSESPNPSQSVEENQLVELPILPDSEKPTWYSDNEQQDGDNNEAMDVKTSSPSVDGQNPVSVKAGIASSGCRRRDDTRRNLVKWLSIPWAVAILAGPALH